MNASCGSAARAFVRATQRSFAHTWLNELRVNNILVNVLSLGRWGW